jgi:hypothetical protein
MLVALVVAFAALSVSAPAGAVDSDLKYAYAFRVGASNGYSILAYAGNERADGRGAIALIVSRRDSAAIYVAPVQLTATSIEADLGPLGRISLDVEPSGREKTETLRCGEEPETIRFEPILFRGEFEFRGEEGFTDATSTSPREYTRFFLRFACAGVGGGETSGPGLPGARLGLHSSGGPVRLDLRVNKNRPAARTRFEVETREKRGKVRIIRSMTGWVGAGAFDYDPLLRTASLAPPQPFSGQASFARGAASARRWTGDLSVDLPGRSAVPLTGAGIDAGLVHACRQEGPGRSPC